MLEYLNVSVLCSAMAVAYLASLQEPSILAIFVKILPCVFLFLHLHKKHIEDTRLEHEAGFLDDFFRFFEIESACVKEKRQIKMIKKNRRAGDRKVSLRRQLREGVAFGLLLSIVGDVLLIWIHLEAPFILGMLAFGGAQVCYIRGLGFSSSDKLRGTAIYVIFLGLTIYVLKDAPLIFKVTVLFYGAALSTTLWRALARYGEDDGRSTTQKLFSVLGALIFVVSDTFIALDQFVLEVNPSVASAAIHATYFSAQTLLALGAA